MGRNNWMFYTSSKGSEAVAIMVTIVEMVKSNGTDVYVCHRYLVEKAPS